jgi:hypothetical protein
MSNLTEFGLLALTLGGASVVVVTAWGIWGLVCLVRWIVAPRVRRVTR